MTPWQRLSPTTCLRDVRWAHFAATGPQGTVLISVGDNPRTQQMNEHTVYVRAERAGHFAGRMEEWLPSPSTLRSIALGRGVAPDAVVAVPSIDWDVSGARVRDEARREVLLSHLRHSDSRALHSRRAEATDRVDEVKAVYGLMLSDVAYRIENSAMFDSAVPSTRDLETALALWADVGPTTPDNEVLRLSAVVKVAFDTARAHAETVGLAHLPLTARSEAGRAAKAARLAARASTDSERIAAQDQVIRILRTLALYYLPSPAVYGRELEGTR